MCAIAGIIEYNNERSREMQEYAAENMIAALKRRGPDDDGAYYGENAVIAHTRLAVIDPVNGVQPMIYEENGRKLVLSYNGELYNTAELRQELESLGYRFKTAADTEAVLLSYAEWGEECVKRFNGIFAFAVWDEYEKRLFAARDRIGVKPFFYTVKDGSLYFSSEIKGILCNGEIKARVDISGIREIMLLGPSRSPGCGVFEGIEELRPAECLVFSESGLKKHMYWDFSAGADEKFTDDIETVMEKVRFLVTDAIARQTVSDVPLCAFLSGGLDSSLISSVTNERFKETGRTLHTFSVEYRDNQKYFRSGKFQPDSDDEYIKIMADYLGGVHHRVVIDTPELVDALYEAVQARDLPGMADVDSSLLLFCRKVKDEFTVALSGECADEIFGGYPWYRDKDIRMTDGFPWSQSTAYRAGLMKDEFVNVPDGVTPSQFVYSKYLGTIGRVWEEGLSPLEKRMREMTRLNLEWFMQTLLDRKDRMSMWSGLEVRVPFCDYRIVEYLYRVPWEFKDYMGREKGLLRKAMEEKLPPEIVRRKKSPYPKTHNPSYEAAVRERLREELSQTYCPVLDVLKRNELEKLINGGGNVQWYGQLMNYPQIMAYILQVNYWLKTYNVEIVQSAF